ELAEQDLDKLIGQSVAECFPQSCAVTFYFPCRRQALVVARRWLAEARGVLCVRPRARLRLALESYRSVLHPRPLRLELGHVCLPLSPRRLIPWHRCAVSFDPIPSSARWSSATSRPERPWNIQPSM